MIGNTLRRVTSFHGEPSFSFRSLSYRKCWPLRAGKSRNHAGDRRDEEGKDRIVYHKSRGQHILTNPRVLDAIVQKSGVSSSDTILEIGPGTGNLTMKLLEKGNHVVAVEIDHRMVEILRNRVSEAGMEEKITVIAGDVLKTQFPEFDIIVANIPYGISSPLIAKFLFGGTTFSSATLLLQKEFAKRLVAEPGDSEYNRLAANVKLVSEVRFLMDVSKREFVPCPRVDSSLVKIEPKVQIPSVDLKEWLGFTRSCFSKKNRTLGAIFKQKKKVMELMMMKKKRRRCFGDEVGNCTTITAAGDHENYDDEEEDEEEEAGGGMRRRSRISDCISGDGDEEMEMGVLKEKLIGVLSAGGFDVKRPSKLCNEELLSLLSMFHEAGIRFS